MTEAALNIIENYLSLVRKYLPDSIANDIVDEIRDYIIEAAEEEGGGTLTEESAKRTVARFGAPSEVAAEYKASMLTDEDTAQAVDTKKDVPTAGSQLVSSGTERPVSTGNPDLTSALLRFFIAAAFWAVVTSIVPNIIWGIAAPAALLFSIVLVAIYLSTSTLFGFFVIVYNEANKITPIERDCPDWTLMQRITSFPDRFLPVQSNFGVIIEALVMAGAIVLLAMDRWWWQVIPLLLARYPVMFERMKGRDPAQYVKVDAVIEFCTLLMLNFLSGYYGFIIVFNNPIYYGPGWALWPVAILVGAYILIRLTAMGPDLWTKQVTTNDRPIAPAVPEAERYEVTDDRRTGKAASYGGSLLKAAIVSVFWTVALSIPLFAAANPYDAIVFVILFACLIQMPLLVGLQLLNSARTKMKGTILWNEEQKTWLALRRFLTFPKGVFRNQSRFMLLIDMLASLSSAVIMVYAFTVLLIPLFAEVVMYVLVIAVSVRFLFLYDRWTNGAARRYDLGEFLSTLVTVLVGNYLMMMILHGPYYLWIRHTASYFVISAVYWPFWIIYGVYLLYSLVARGQTLWHDESAPPKAPEEKSVSSEKAPKSEKVASWGKLESRYHQALRHTLGWNVVIGLVALIIYLLGTTNASQVVPLIFNQGFIFLLVSFTMGGFIFTTFYFLWRKGIVDSGKSSATVGRRGRFQSFIDLGLTGFALFWIMSEVNMQSSFTRRLTSAYVQYMGQLSIAQGQIGSVIVATAFISLIFAVPIVRLISDLVCLIRNDSEFSNQAMLVSGVLFCILVGLTLGMIPLAGNAPSSIMPPPVSGEVVTLFLVLLLVILIVWQMITSRIKLAELPVGARVPSGEHVVEDLGYGEIDLPIN